MEKVTISTTENEKDIQNFMDLLQRNGVSIHDLYTGFKEVYERCDNSKQKNEEAAKECCCDRDADVHCKHACGMNDACCTDHIDSDDDASAFEAILEEHRADLALFLGQDPDITVDADVTDRIINVVVTGDEDKAAALRMLLSTSIDLYYADVDILVNNESKQCVTGITKKIIETALKDNPLVDCVLEKQTDDGPVFSVVLLNKTVQKRCLPVSPFAIETLTASCVAEMAMCDVTECDIYYATTPDRDILCKTTNAWK